MAGRFKLDENLPLAARDVFSRAGHEVETALDEQLGGKPDSAIVNAARAEDRILVTLDLDFADIRAYPPSGQPGIWVLRPGAQDIGSVLSLLRGALEIFETEPARDQTMDC